ncbi:hypothetical protein [Gordonia sp. ABSL49_1]|nr:hypothetical protein [Gordonia sp. ABSL49_1]MCH5644798.1 hypothetical protein [Gordonia sp. ABSL49_1]
MAEADVDRTQPWLVLLAAIGTGVTAAVYAALLWNVRTKAFFAAEG